MDLLLILPSVFSLSLSLSLSEGSCLVDGKPSTITQAFDEANYQSDHDHDDDDGHGHSHSGAGHGHSHGTGHGHSH